jgi:hypothetical protein
LGDRRDGVKTLMFAGSSDDTFGEISPRGDDYDNCASGEPIEYRVQSGDEALIVFGQYCPGNACGWVVGVAPVDGDTDARDIPAWPIRIRPGDRCYSPVLEIDVPDDAKLTCLQLDSDP